MKNIRCLSCKIAAISILCLHLISCDSGDVNSNQEGVENPNTGDITAGDITETQLMAHFNTFEEEAAKRDIALNPERIANLSIKFAPLEPGVTGLCTSKSDGYTEIKIASSLRGTNTEWVVIHELGHCILNMLHRDTALSIMNSAINESALDQADREQLFDEFFDLQYFERFF